MQPQPEAKADNAPAPIGAAEWTWIVVLNNVVSAAETTALIAAGRRAGNQRCGTVTVK